MTSVKVRRLASNPRKRRSVARYRPAAKRVKARAANPKRHARRTLSAKQIKFFGTAAQRAALKRKRKRAVKAAPVKRRRVAKANPVRKRRRVVAKAAPRKRHRRVAKSNPVRKRRRAVAAAPVRRRRRVAKANPVRRKARRRSNPALVLTLGSVNPRRKTMKRRKRHSTVARRRRANPTRITVRARSRRNGVRRRHAHRRNPGIGSGINMVTSIGGGLLGVTIAKAVPGMLPSSMQSPIMRIAVAAGAGYAGKMLAHKMRQPALGDAILFGALMQAGSTALNAWLPSVGGQIGLNGLGDLVPSAFTIPQNPLRYQQPLIGPQPVPMMAPVAPNLGSARGAFGSAW